MKFISLVLSICLLSSRAFSAEVRIPSKRTLRQQVNLYVELLDKEVLKAKLQKDKVDAVKRVSSLIQDLSAQSEGASLQDRRYSEYLLEGLKTIPTGKRFKNKNCDSYHNNVEELAQTWSDADAAKEALAPTQRILQAVCTQ